MYLTYSSLLIHSPTHSFTLNTHPPTYSAATEAKGSVQDGVPQQLVVFHLQGSRSVEGQGIIPRSISKVRAPLWFAASPCWPSAARQPSLPLGTWQLHVVVISDGAHLAHTPNPANMVV